MYSYHGNRFRGVKFLNFTTSLHLAILIPTITRPCESRIDPNLLSRVGCACLPPYWFMLWENPGLDIPLVNKTLLFTVNGYVMYRINQKGCAVLRE